MRRKRRPWTEQDAEWLRKLHGEGKSDVAIAYILDRLRQTVRLQRVKLGLPTHNQNRGARGWHHGPGASAKIAASNRRRWLDPEFRARQLLNLRLGIAVSAAKRWRVPPMDEMRLRQYRKLREALGPEAARAALPAILG